MPITDITKLDIVDRIILGIEGKTALTPEEAKKVEYEQVGCSTILKRLTRDGEHELRNAQFNSQDNIPVNFTHYVLGIPVITSSSSRDWAVSEHFCSIWFYKIREEK